MTNNNAQEHAAKTASDSGPVARELAEWLKAFRVGWTQSLGLKHEKWTDKQKLRFRLMYALSGSFTWVGGTVLIVLGDPLFANIFTLTNEPVTAFALLVAMLFALWTGWLVAFADRKAGPIRLFLDGLLLPTATVALLGLSAQRIQPVITSRLPMPPVTLRPPAPDGAKSSGNGSESVVPQSSDESERANEMPR